MAGNTQIDAQCTALFTWKGQIKRCQLPENHPEDFHEVEFDGQLWRHETAQVIVMEERQR
jgi:hypothetical protein